MKHIFILFGSTGDIYNKKIYSSLYNLNDNFIALCLGRNKLHKNEFYNLIKNGLKTNQNNFDNFFKNFEYIKVDYDDIETYNNIIRFIELNYINNSKIIFYFGIPAFATVNILKNIHKLKINKLNNSFFLIEKPFGNSFNQFIDYCQIINYNDNNNYLFIDHYRAKNKLIQLKHNINNYLKNNTKKITIEIYETNDINNRVNYFENYGLINDMFQSHILSILQYIFGNYFYLQQIPIVKDLTIKQYDNYPISNSKTETFFDLLLTWNNIDINIICGKKMNNEKRTITFEYFDNSINIYDFTDNNNEYINLFNDVIKYNGKNLFLSYKDNINYWNITNNILLFKDQIIIKYY
jgi:glucose-6-phosphate 1-dehydrogenase